MKTKQLMVTVNHKMTEWCIKGKHRLDMLLRDEKGEGGGINWTAVTIAGIVLIGLALVMFKDMLPGLGDNLKSKIGNFG